MLKLLMKTTKTAQYAADAANNSCLFAVVRDDMAKPNSRVKMIKIPIASNGPARWPRSDSWYLTCRLACGVSLIRSNLHGNDRQHEQDENDCRDDQIDEHIDATSSIIVIAKVL